MTQRIKTLLSVLMLAALAVPTVLAGDKADQKMQEAWAKYMQANENHEFLAKGVGCWDVETTMYEGEGKEPVKSKAMSKDKMVFDGRYLKSHFQGEINGMPFKGIGYTGYDNAAKKFVSTWMDNMGTGITTMTGDMDESGKTIVFNGEAVNPLTGKNQQFKSVMTLVDDDKQTFVMYDVEDDGTEVKTFEMVYTRKQCDGSCKDKAGCAKACKGSGHCCQAVKKSCKTEKGCDTKKSCATQKSCDTKKSCATEKKCPVTGKTGTCTATKNDAESAKKCPVTGKTGTCTRADADKKSECPHSMKTDQDGDN